MDLSKVRGIKYTITTKNTLAIFKSKSVLVEAFLTIIQDIDTQENF